MSTNKQALLKKLNRRLNDAFGFQRTSGGKHTTISLSIDECKSVLVALDELDKWQQESSTWQSVAEKQLAIAIEAEKRIAELSAGHSKLRETMAAIHNTIKQDGFATPLAVIMQNAKRAHEESAAAAGITVKGDSK